MKQMIYYIKDSEGKYLGKHKKWHGSDGITVENIIWTKAKYRAFVFRAAEEVISRYSDIRMKDPDRKIAIISEVIDK